MLLTLAGGHARLPAESGPHRSQRLSRPPRSHLAISESWTDNDLVFATRHGGPIERTEDWRSWKAILRQAQVRDARVHDARHTARDTLGPAMSATATQTATFGPQTRCPSPGVVRERDRDLRRLGDLNPGWARTQTALAVRRHRPD